MKLKYWIKILLMDDSRLVKQVYRRSKEKYIKEGQRNWCLTIHKLVLKYKLEFLWKEERAIVEVPGQAEVSFNGNGSDIFIVRCTT